MSYSLTNLIKKINSPKDKKQLKYLKNITYSIAISSLLLTLFLVFILSSNTLKPVVKKSYESLTSQGISRLSNTEMLSATSQGVSQLPNTEMLSATSNMNAMNTMNKVLSNNLSETSNISSLNLSQINENTFKNFLNSVTSEFIL